VTETTLAIEESLRTSDPALVGDRQC